MRGVYLTIIDAGMAIANANAEAPVCHACEKSRHYPARLGNAIRVLPAAMVIATAPLSQRMMIQTAFIAIDAVEPSRAVLAEVIAMRKIIIL